MSQDFYAFCYDLYFQEMRESDALYQRAGVMLIALPILGTITITLGRIDILKLCFPRIEIYSYYFIFLVAVLSIVVSVVFLFLCVYPRKYATLAALNFWYKWREEYTKYLDGKKDHEKNSDVNDLETAMINNLCSRFVEAQPVNAEINEKRRKAFQKSIMTAGIAFLAIVLQTLFYLVLKIQGV